MQKLLFPLGQVVATPGALGLGVNFYPYLRRHQCGDWGELDAEDRDENDFSVRNNLRLLSAYRTPSGAKFWIITEADRSATTVLLPSEY
jgi:hypothetical protein